ncbi:hypothetical protein J6590_042738 [Homalodisca vitripennis]|nr:hypothetical protein J6590_042738 [Homalodisca vitripennis]
MAGFLGTRPNGQWNHYNSLHIKECWRVVFTPPEIGEGCGRGPKISKYQIINTPVLLFHVFGSLFHDETCKLSCESIEKGKTDGSDDVTTRMLVVYLQLDLYASGCTSQDSSQFLLVNDYRSEEAKRVESYLDARQIEARQYDLTSWLAVELEEWPEVHIIGVYTEYLHYRYHMKPCKPIFTELTCNVWNSPLGTALREIRPDTRFRHPPPPHLHSPFSIKSLTLAPKHARPSILLISSGEFSKGDKPEQ